MKSALFESLNDRQNIANAYMRMVNEANEFEQQEIAKFKEVLAEKEFPLTLYNWDSGESFIADLSDIGGEYKAPEYYEKGTDEYYIALAFDVLDTADVYQRLISSDSDFCLTPETLYTLNGDCSMTMGDVKSELIDIGKGIENEWHKGESEIAVPFWAVSALEYDDYSGLNDDDIEMVKSWKQDLERDGYELMYDGEDMGFRSVPEFGDACNCIKFYIRPVNPQNESVEEDNDGSLWFSENGELLKEIPDECVNDCTQSGRDAYEYCKEWVKRLGFENGLDLALAKGYLKSTGGWDTEELKTLSPEETAIKLLWVLCGDIKDGIENPSIDSGKLYIDDFVVNESTYHGYNIVLTNIDWKEKDRRSYDGQLPSRDSMWVEVADGGKDELKNAINGIYIDSFGFKPKSYKIVKCIDTGERSDDRRDEMVNQTELDKLKKKNPKLKDISEQM